MLAPRSEEMASLRNVPINRCSVASPEAFRHLFVVEQEGIPLILEAFQEVFTAEAKTKSRHHFTGEGALLC